MKALKRVALAIVLLVLALAVGAALSLDAIARRTVEDAGTFALGVETTLGSADVALGSRSSVELEGLVIANPPGFRSADFLRMRQARMELRTGTLLEDETVSPLLRLEGLDLNLERGGTKTNYGVILANLERLGSGEGGEDEPQEGGGRTFTIERMVLLDVHATIDLIPLIGDATRISLEIPEIVLEDLGRGMTAAGVFDLVIHTLLAATIEAGGSVLPTEILQDLGGRAGSLGTVAFEVTEGVVKTVDGVVQGVVGGGAKTLGKGVEKLGKTVGGVLEGLGGLLDKKKRDD